MQSQWSSRWSITDHNRKFRGGQGHGQRVHDAAGRDGFLKLISRPKAEQSRKRFAREVASFSTLDHAGLPALLDDNATEWRNRGVELFLVLEYIEGCTLAEFVDGHSEIDLIMALSTIRRVLEIVAHCHRNDVVHRDIKPNNIVMRQGDAADPVLVDFGLSFNSALEIDGVTRVGEEVGNRFLRLPEHATGGRSAVSDLTQVVGLLCYMLTHSEPRVLEDEAGLKPHQRSAERVAIGLAASGGQLIRLLDLFDRAFSTKIDDRFATASDLADSLDRVTASGPELRSISELEGAVALKVSNPREHAIVSNGSMLQHYIDSARRAADALATKHGLQCSWGQGRDDLEAVRAYRVLRLSLAAVGTIPSRFLEFGFELCSAEDVRMVVNSDVVWRGSDPTELDFVESITRPLMELYLAPL